MSEFITKYFELDTWKYFAAGKIKFGSLEEYGKEENCLAMGAKFDALEGVALESASVQSLGQSQYINIPGVIEIFLGARQHNNNTRNTNKVLRMGILRVSGEI